MPHTHSSTREPLLSKYDSLVAQDGRLSADVKERSTPKVAKLTAEQRAAALKTLRGPPGVVTTNFGVDITREDIHTLGDASWLNDEVHTRTDFCLLF